MLDPNYLWKVQFSQSYFHRFIHIWANVNLNSNLPLWHIDIHGKKDRPKNRKIDVGILTTLELWAENHSKTGFLVDFKKSILKNLSQAFEGVTVNSFKVEPDMNPRLHG